MGSIITEEVTKAINSLIPVMDGLCAKYENLSYKMGERKNSNGIYIKYHGKKIADLWAFERKPQIIFHYYSYFIREEDRLKAVELPKNSRKEDFHLNHMGEKVYNHTEQYESYKMECTSVQEIVYEIEKTISVFTGICFDK